MEESEGYPFVFQMIDSDSADEWLIETLQYTLIPQHFDLTLFISS